MNPRNAIEAVTHPQPYTYYAQGLAGSALVCDDSLGLWVAYRAEPVQTVLAHTAFAVRPLHEPVPTALLGSPMGDVFAALVRMNEGPLHEVGKPVLQQALASVNLDDVARWTRHFTPDGLASERWNGWARALGPSVVAALLGFDEAAVPGIADRLLQFVASLSPGCSVERRAQAVPATEALLNACETLDAPHGSLGWRVLASAQAAGWEDRSAVLANLIGLMSQSAEASAGLIANSLVALAQRPGARDFVRQGPDHAMAWVREVSRYDPPIQNTRRFVVRDVALYDVSLAIGDTVLLVLAAANRDPAALADPHLFLPERWLGGAEVASMSFGAGRHACPGQRFAWTIAAAALAAVCEATSDWGSVRWTYQHSHNARIPVFA